MADIAVSAGNVRATHPSTSIIYDGLVSEAVTAGQTVHLHTDGKYRVGDTNVSGRQQVRGIALNDAGTGRPSVSVLVYGPVAGYTTNMPAYDALVYASDTAGAVGTTAGTVSAAIGRVTSIPDGGTPTKVIQFNFLGMAAFA